MGPSDVGLGHLRAMHAAAAVVPEETLRRCVRLRLVALTTKVLGLLARALDPKRSAAAQEWAMDVLREPERQHLNSAFGWVDALRNVCDTRETCSEGGEQTLCA